MNEERTGSAIAAGGSKPWQDQADFSLVLGGPLYQLLRRARLSDDALMLQRRRVIVISLLTWLPLLLLAALGGRLFGGVAAGAWAWAAFAKASAPARQTAATEFLENVIRNLLLFAAGRHARSCERIVD